MIKDDDEINNYSKITLEDLDIEGVNETNKINKKEIIQKKDLFNENIQNY